MKIAYDKTDEKSVLKYASKLENKNVRWFLERGQVDESGYSVKSTNKGRFGLYLEEVYFGIKNNNRKEPDFVEIGMELKVAPLRKNSRGYSSKERMVLGKLDFQDALDNGFMCFERKGSRILIVFYEWAKDTDNRDYKVRKVVDWTPSPEELRIIKEDWDIIQGRIAKGEAHLLSERHTRILSACTKGVDGSVLVDQPVKGSPKAKPRALSLKAGFMTTVFRDHAGVSGKVYKGQVDYESVMTHGWDKDTSFDDYVIAHFQPFIGKTCEEIESALNLKLNRTTDKGYYSKIALGIMGVTHGKKVKEFVQAEIEMKTVRITHTGMPKEDTSFPTFDLDFDS